MKNSFLSNLRGYPKGIFWTIVGLYIFLYAPYGINDSDGGFIKALAYRLSLGERPYQDFIYVRPPWSIFQHYLEMLFVPKPYELLVERALFYLKMALVNVMGAYIVLKARPVVYFWALVGFVVSVHNYAPAAWHTIDGIFYGVLAFYMVYLKGRNEGAKSKVTPFLYIFIGSLFIVLSVLSKQSFIPLLLVWPVYLFFKKGVRDSLVGVLGLVVGYLVFYSLMNAYGLWQDYKFWTGQATSLYEAFDHGIMTYFRLNLIVASTGIFIIGLYFLKNRRHKKGLFILLILSWIITYILGVWKNQDFYFPESQIKVVTLWMTIFWLTIIVKKGQQVWSKYIDLWALFILSGLTSLSWGFDVPILFSLPILLSVGYWYDTYIGDYSEGDYKWKGLLIVLLCGAFLYGYQFIYRDGPRRLMTTKLSSVFPDQKGIYTSPQHLAKMSALKENALKMPRFAVLPSMPLAHYLTETKPILPLDWVIDAETNGNNTSLIKKINDDSFYIFVEVDMLDDLTSRPERNPVTNYVIKHCPLIEKGTFFNIYKSH